MAEVRITPLGPRTYVRLKSWLPTQLPSCIGSTELPASVGTMVPGLACILCLGPDEWLVTSAARPIRNLMNNLAGDLPDGLALIDLSDAFSGLEIQGAAARALLSKGCGLDLHPSAFRTGQCARTRFAQIPLVISCHDRERGNSDSCDVRFEIYVARSYFDYLHGWLLDAAIEFEAAAETA